MNTADFLKYLTRPLLADGAWGTEFVKLGLSSGEAPELWNLTKANKVETIAAGYVRAGSDIILTNSFGGSRYKLEKYGAHGQTAEINRRAAEISKAAAAAASAVGSAAAGSAAASTTAGPGTAASGTSAASAASGAVDSAAARPGIRRVLTAGDIGPTGKMVIMGEISDEEAYACFAEQAEALAAGGADLIVIETMSDLAEIVPAVRASAATGLAVIASMTFEKTVQGEYRTIMGNSPEESISRLLEAGAAVVGANCGTGIDNYMELAVELCRESPVPVWIKANAGLPELIDGQVRYRMSAGEFCGYIPALLDTGVSIIGGCCGTNPDFIRRARQIIDTRL